MARLLTILCVLLASATLARAQTYLGNWSANPYASNSLSNSYGAGSPYDPHSVTNPYGRYGSPYSPDSVRNPPRC